MPLVPHSATAIGAPEMVMVEMNLFWLRLDLCFCHFTMSEAGPSRSQPPEMASRAAAAETEEEEDDERVDLKLIQSFAE